MPALLDAQYNKNTMSSINLLMAAPLLIPLLFSLKSPKKTKSLKNGNYEKENNLNQYDFLRLSIFV